MTWECVYTVSEYYDGPRRGVADFRGRPHVYESQFSDLQDGYTDRFLLTEIDSELFRLALEDWSIWLRWRAAFDLGDVSLDTHPALPEDRERHRELEQLIGSRLRADPSKCTLMGAEFRKDGKAGGGLEVQWHDVDTSL
jgi:hypothetical protein